ncbi:MAG: triose-phosphate isomerase [Coriobacteriales bacterium]|jgi:triosephosphate isomerase|nr:triose-phosphate isomerase [Coriobacteriales bacterium]
MNGNGRTPLIVGNWKMNKTTGQAVVLAQDIANLHYRDYKTVETVLCPPFVDLKSVNGVLEYDRSALRLGAQDVFWEISGAYTGAISPEMLREVGCSYCIVGHSERRAYFGETDADVNRKVHALLRAGIVPIICVGEGLELRDAGDRQAESFILEQVEAALEGLNDRDVSTIVIAYEPIWAIGTGRTATPEQAQAVSVAIRACLGERCGWENARKLRILYGGSLKPENVALFVPMPDIDGGLIGGASLDARAFIDLMKAWL